jgi:hypothetical protein
VACRGTSDIHVVSDAWGLPLGAVITGPAPMTACKPKPCWWRWSSGPPGTDVPVDQPDPRDLPRSRADGAYDNRPTQGRANAAEFRREVSARPGAASRGRTDSLCGGALRCVPVPVRADRATAGPRRQALPRLGPTRRLCDLSPTRRQRFCPVARRQTAVDVVSEHPRSNRGSNNPIYHSGRR